MLLVEANGGIEKDRTLAEEVMWFCIETLMPRMKNLMVECELKKIEDGVLGYAWSVEDNKDCLIQIDSRLSRDAGRDMRWFMSGRWPQTAQKRLIVMDTNSCGNAKTVSIATTVKPHMNVNLGKQRHMRWKVHLQNYSKNMKKTVDKPS